jgi:two-component system response regulator GlrR
MTLQDHLETGATPEQMHQLAAMLAANVPSHGIITRNAEVLRLINLCYAIRAKTAPDDSVLILGSSGTGKELFAHLFAQPSLLFLPINCASLPDTLVQALLFGHEKGSFTGAVDNRDGIFVAANSGTVFLDEVGDMPLPQQANLLRVLENRTVLPVGSNKPRKIYCRIVAATNIDVNDPAKFRQDLLGRFSFVVRLPSLTDRGEEDLQALCRHFGLSMAGLETIRDQLDRFGVRAIKRAAAVERLAY